MTQHQPPFLSYEDAAGARRAMRRYRVPEEIAYFLYQRALELGDPKHFDLLVNMALTTTYGQPPKYRVRRKPSKPTPLF